jgi:hypothetical protein
MAIYPIIEKEHLHKFASFTLALCKLPLSSDRSFTPNWKNEILCSKPKGTGKGTASGTGEGTDEETDDNPPIEGADQMEQLKLAQMGVGFHTSSTRKSTTFPPSPEQVCEWAETMEKMLKEATEIAIRQQVDAPTMSG